MSPDALAALGNAVGQAVGKTVVSCEPLAKSGGFTRALRCQARFTDGSSAFVKAATEPESAQWIKTETIVYETLGKQLYLADYFGSIEYGVDSFPALILEDLTEAHWGPPWHPGDTEKVCAAIDAFHPLANRFPDGFLPAQEDQRADLAGWKRVQGETAPFLSLGLCSPEWLENALPTLIQADADAVLDGDDLVHQDIRSDNLCFPADGRVVIVDWNWACRGNGKLDLAGWAPSLHREGGIAPEELLPNEPQLAALLAGFWAYNAGRPPFDFPGAERIRAIQKLQLRFALPWATRSLGLPKPDKMG